MEKRIDLICDWHCDEEFLQADGFDGAILGIYGEKLVYSRKKCIRILMERDGMDEEEANEYFDYNVECAYVGEKTPIWVDDTMFDE
jgi:hypothetical protein